jgi:nucleoside-diphosphate-sugar epimerase
MRVLVTGGAGYIGSILSGQLLEEGYEVVCLDRLIFGDKGIRNYIGTSNFKLIVDDTRTFDPQILHGIDVVVDLAAISQPDPSGLLSRELFYNINYRGPLRVANLSKKYGVKRYIFASTCSVYGFQEGLISEESRVNPLEEYAKTKLMAENELRSLCSDKFCVTILRFATVYGLSDKMRFDLVVNGMTLSLYKAGIIRVMRPGTQVRPVVHVIDVARAIMTVIKAEIEKVCGEVFNVGSNEQNYQIYELAEVIGNSIGKPFNIEWYGEPDARSYRVDFTKIKNRLGFKTLYTPREGAREIYRALEDGRITETPETNVIRWWKLLQDQGKIS